MKQHGDGWRWIFHGHVLWGISYGNMLCEYVMDGYNGIKNEYIEYIE
jgi:hypothetical protein